MFRKFIAASIAALGLMVVATPGTSAAMEPTNATVAHEHFTVYYRTCSHDSWRQYGCFDCVCEAGRAADRLRAQGYQAMVR